MSELPLIVVLHWGDLSQTAACIASLALQTCAADLLLIDNGGELNATAALRAMAPGARLLRSDTNLGVAGGRNLGLEMALEGKTTVVAADTHYRGHGFTQDVARREEYAALLAHLLSEPPPRPDVERARRYASFFFFRFLVQ